nr:PREDICTED: sterile alpha motif domain-containing protein 9 [Latimeria chalumnae]|eukprot:XP_006000513.2 PREDICTED: sterile alpha motif domain-containing protein 9 [Latimeria chalumnae]
MIEELNLDPVYANILQEEEVSGARLIRFEKHNLLQIGIKAGPTVMMLRERDGYQKRKANEQTTQSPTEPTLGTEPTSGAHQSKRTCQPHPFDMQQGPHRYIVNCILVPETGPSNLIDPCHEYKSFRNTGSITEKMKKFTDEVFRFASACMNCRTNGTIHFGVEDTMEGFAHGEILGVEVGDPSKYVDIIKQEISKYFLEKYDEDAKKCIRPPRFVEVLNHDQTSLERHVIEVDVVPDYSLCLEKVYYIQTKVKRNRKMIIDRCLFIRDGASSRNIFPQPDDTKKKELNKFLTGLPQLSEARKAAEENYSRGSKVMNQGLKLMDMITGGKNMLDDSRYNYYILVTNKCHTTHMEHFEFLKELDLFAVLDFDPESADKGVCKAYCKYRLANLHFPKQFKDIESRLDKIEQLNLYRQTSWVFCNGREGFTDPSKNSDWLTEKGAEVRHVVSFLCGKDVLQNGKFLVVFLLLSPVDSVLDPVLETFSTFRQELSGLGSMFCICENQTIFQQWKDLIQARYETDISSRCVYNITLAEVNGTILSIKTRTRTSRRFLPGAGFTSVELEKKDEDSMASFDILCKNECEGTEAEKGDSFREFRQFKEEHFYRGGKVCWWNFYFTELPGSVAFIKRDRHKYLYEMITGTAQSSKRACETFNLFHQPGCGGTTLAMHVLWELRKKFRCAVLKDNTDKFTEVARQVIQLAIYGQTELSHNTPVLLMVDDLEELEIVQTLESHILEAVAENNLRPDKPIALILNCMRSQDPERSRDLSDSESTFLINRLSGTEQRFFVEKLKEIEENHKKPETFYGFMIMKKNFDSKYIEGLVRNIVKGFNMTTKNAQLLSFLVLLNHYVTDSSISMSLCEEFLEVSCKENQSASGTIDEEMGGYSSLFISTEVHARERYEGIRIIHPLVAKYCLNEVRMNYNVSQRIITEQLLAENVFYGPIIGTTKLKNDVKSMIVSRHYKEDGKETALFSPLIEAIEKEENADVAGVLCRAAKRFYRNPYIPQALARYFYLKKKDFPSAHSWAENARQKASDSSYIADTVGQVFKSELKSALEAEHAAANQLPLTPENLRSYLKLASSALEAFRNCQDLAEKEHGNRQRMKEKTTKMYGTYNTLGYLGDIDVCLTIVDILENTPLFQRKHQDRKSLLNYLSGHLQVANIKVCDGEDQKFQAALKDYNSNLCNLKIKLEDAFRFYEEFFTFFKCQSSEKAAAEAKLRKKVSDNFAKYIDTFFLSDTEREKEKKRKATIGLQLLENEKRSFLRCLKGDTFAGLLGHLLEEEASPIEEILKSYTFILERGPNRSGRDKENWILANIILNCLKPESHLTKGYKILIDYLKNVRSMTGSNQQHFEPLFLASLLLWPSQSSEMETNFRDVSTCINMMRRHSLSKYRHFFRSKQPTVFFYLGKEPGLNRYIHKAKIEQCIGPVENLKSLWQSGKIWKEKKLAGLLVRMHGRAQGRKIYLEGDSSYPIEVHPANLGQLRTGGGNEKVSFYLGFSINGPTAHDIEIVSRP